jgi:choline dehydrogenase-like flavoprotein
LSEIFSQDRDKYDQQKINLKWKLNNFDIRNIREHLKIIDSELQKQKLGYMDIELHNDEPPGNIHGGWHHMGTTRMHTDSNQGVVDEHCKIHGVNNLFIAGYSVFPTGGYANPTLTLMALSIRLADHFKSHFN